jgi:hypothetical protein
MNSLRVSNLWSVRISRIVVLPVAFLLLLSLSPGPATSYADDPPEPSNCVTTTTTKPALDEDGIEIPGADPVTITDTTCTYNDGNLSDVTTSPNYYEEYPFYCGWNRGAFVQAYSSTGTGVRRWEWRYYDENGRLRNTGASGYWACGGSLCLHQSTFAANSNKNVTVFSVTWPTTGVAISFARCQ